MTSVSTDRRQGLNAGAAIKVPALAATTANITLSGEQTIDGYAAITGDRILVKSQTDGTQNGVYVVDTGTWTRDLDFDGAYDARQGTLIAVVNGTQEGYWRIATVGAVVFGTTSITFEQALTNDGASIGYVQEGTGAQATNVQERLRYPEIHAFEFIPPALHSAIEQGTDTTDHTPYLVLALNAAESYATGRKLRLCGTLNASGLRPKRALICGEGMGRAAQQKHGAGTKLVHIPGSTTDLIAFDVDTTAEPNMRLMPGVRDIFLQGCREQTQATLCRIVSAASRTSLVVNTTDLASITLPDSAETLTTWPFFGFCYFYSSENRYLGYGMVTAINTGTGAVTLATGWDNYATKTGSGALLTNTEKIVFSGRRVSTDDPTLDGRPDISMAGKSGIVQSDGQQGMIIQDVNFANWHSCITRGNGLVIVGDNIWTEHSTHGLVRRDRARGSDDIWGLLFIQGRYRADMDLPAETGTFDDSEYRVCAVSTYGIGALDVFDTLVSDAAVISCIETGGTQNAHIKHFQADNPVKYGLAIMGSSSRPGISIGTLIARTPITLPSTINHQAGFDRAVIVNPAGVVQDVNIGTAMVSRWITGTHDFAAFSCNGTAAVRIRGNMLVAPSGLTAVSTDTGLRRPQFNHVVHGPWDAPISEGHNVPAMTAANRSALSAPLEQDEIFQTDSGPGRRIYIGGAWRNTPLVLASSGANVSGAADTAENILATVTIPAGMMGTNGSLLTDLLATVNNDASSKIVRVRFGGIGGTIYGQWEMQNLLTLKTSVRITNNNSATSQKGWEVSVAASFGTSTNAIVTSAIDTTAATTLVITVQKADGADTMTLNSYQTILQVP